MTNIESDQTLQTCVTVRGAIEKLALSPLGEKAKKFDKYTFLIGYTVHSQQLILTSSTERQLDYSLQQI